MCVCVCVCVCIPHLLYPFIYLWDLAYFHVLVIINNAVMNIGVHISFHVSVFVFFDCNTQTWNCWKHETFILWLHQFTTPPTKLKSSLFSISFPPVDTTWWHSFWQVWGSNSLWAAFAFPWWLVVLIIFSCVCWHSTCILWKDVRGGSQTTFQFYCFPDVELYQFFIYFGY